MRRRYWRLAVGLSVLMVVLFAGVVSGAGPGQPAWRPGPTREVAADRPLKASVTLELEVGKDLTDVVLVYERLSFDEVKRVKASVTGGMAMVKIPAEDTTQPGIRYHWEALRNGSLVSSPEEYIPFIDPVEALIATGEQVAWDIEKAGGKLPGGNTVSAGQARLPHNLGVSSAPVTSKNLELRTISGSEIHKGLDFGMATGNTVVAMLGGYVHKVVYTNPPPADGWGNYVMLRHSAGTETYYSHYGHLATVSVTEKNPDGTPRWVNKGDTLGTSGNTGNSTGPHLDAAFDYYVSSLRVTLYPFVWFLTSPSPYNSTSFDFIQTPLNGYITGGGSYTQVNIKPADPTTVQAFIVYRQQGTSTWTEASMPLYTGTTYRYTWSSSLLGKTMEYYIKVKVAEVSGYWVTRPAYKNAAAPNSFYTITIR